MEPKRLLPNSPQPHIPERSILRFFNLLLLLLLLLFTAIEFSLDGSSPYTSNK